MSIQLILSLLSPFIALFIGFKKRWTLLWMYPFTGLIFDVLISLLKRVWHAESKGLGNLFFLSEFLIISLLYRKQMFRKDGWWYCLAIQVCIAFIVHTVQTGALFKVNKVGASFFSLTYMLYSISGFYVMLKRQEVIQLEKSWFFWLNVAFLMYGSGSFLIFLFREYIISTDKQAYGMIWNNIFLVLNSVKYLLIGVALYYYPANKYPDK